MPCVYLLLPPDEYPVPNVFLMVASTSCHVEYEG